jgi:hypothetical protein
MQSRTRTRWRGPTMAAWAVTAAARLEDEACRGEGVVLPPPLIGAWARKPD